MKSLNLKNIEIVKSALKGKRLEKFLHSIECYQSSLEAGGWLPKMSRSADTGFSQGCGFEIETPKRDIYTEKTDLDYARREVSMSFRFGSGKVTYYQLKLVSDNLTEKELKKITPEFLMAWGLLCSEVDIARKFLDDLRPLPVLTEIGLSPKVTKTLIEMNLDIELSSIKRAVIDYTFVPSLITDKHSENYGKHNILKSSNGALYTLLDRSYYVKWSKGIKHGQSRFRMIFGNCEVCGKKIPSRNFVPLEAFDKKSGNQVSIWSGCDCASNILGIKDVGISIPKTES